jgi:hypothetical protein
MVNGQHVYLQFANQTLFNWNLLSLKTVNVNAMASQQEPRHILYFKGHYVSRPKIRNYAYDYTSSQKTLPMLKMPYIVMSWLGYGKPSSL